MRPTISADPEVADAVALLPDELFDGYARPVGFESAGWISKLIFLVSSIALPALHSWWVYLVGICVVTTLFVLQRLLLVRRREIASTLLFCTVLFAITIPGGTPEELKQAAWISVTLFWLMYSSLLWVLVVERRDLAIAGMWMGLPRSILGAFAALSWMVPTMALAIREVLTAQRARGLELRLPFFFRLAFYEALLVPYIHHVIRSIFDVQVLLHLRPFEVSFARIGGRCQTWYSALLTFLAVVPWAWNFLR